VPINQRDKLSRGKEPNMTIEEILYVLEQNVTSILCGSALDQRWVNGEGSIDDSDVVLLAKALRANTSLTAVDLSRNRLSTQGAIILTDALRVRSQLRSLNFSFINLDEAGLAAFGQALTSYTSLTSILFTGLTKDRIQLPNHLVNFVSTNRSLRHLELRLCKTSQLQRLVETLQHLPQLISLDIRSDLNNSIVTALAAYVKESKTLRSLSLAFSLSQVGTHKNALLEALKRNNTLTSVDLSASRHRCFNGQILAEVLGVNTTLTSIKFYGNHLLPTEVASVVAALRRNTSLRSIGLDSTQFHSLGTQALAEVLMVNTTLTSIDLGGNDILPQGAQAIAAALHVNDSLVSVNLCMNQIGGLGAQAFADSLLVNTSLKTLNFEFNDIGEVGIGAIMAALKRNSSLTSLNVYNTAPKMQLLQAITNMLRVNTTLRLISMPNLSPLGYQHFRPAVENDVHKMILSSLLINPALENFLPRNGMSSHEKALATEFGSEIANVLTRNRRRLFFVRSPHGLRNVILYSLFSKPVLNDLSQGRQLPHIIKFQLTQYAIELSLLNEDILGRAIMAGWCCGCGSSEKLEVGFLGASDYACSFGRMP
jgi:Ran GTPase-activating protein (RanGAP) involved in mRNA processing and transport